MKKTDQDLESEDAWELESAAPHAAVKGSHALMAVRLTAAELDLIDVAAEAENMTALGFIKSAALDAAKRSREGPVSANGKARKRRTS